MRKRALEEVLEQVQRAVEMLRDADADLGVSLSEDTAAAPAPPEGEDRKGDVGVDGDDVATSSVASDSDYETAQVSRGRLVPSRVLLGTSRVPGTRIWISEVQVVAAGVTELVKCVIQLN